MSFLLPDHCIDVLRTSLTCTADISLYTFRWEETNLKKPKLKSNSKRYCVDWEALGDWSRRRAVDLDVQLKRPEWMAEDMHDEPRKSEESQSSFSTKTVPNNFAWAEEK